MNDVLSPPLLSSMALGKRVITAARHADERAAPSIIYYVRTPDALKTSEGGRRKNSFQAFHRQRKGSDLPAAAVSPYPAFTTHEGTCVDVLVSAMIF